jgi:hypothetical protein
MLSQKSEKEKGKKTWQKVIKKGAENQGSVT